MLCLTYFCVIIATLSIENCSSCDPGKCCDSPGTDDFSVPMKPCPPGYYCPTGTANCYQNKCPPGTFDNNNGGLTSAGDCTTCSDGKYCPGGGTTEEDCPPGYFCKAGQISPFENPCPGGTFSTSINLSDGSQCSQCRAGYYCPAGSTHEIECPAGTYNEQTNMPDLLNCLPCQKGFACDNVPISNFATQANNCKPGYYCPRGSKSPDEFPCPAGTYSNSNSLTAASECTPCLQGFYCNFGFTEAIMRTFPCREGYYCPTGSVTETPCPAGTYNDQTEMFQPTDCQTCQAGYFCDIASPTTDFSTQICPNGYTCPAGTERNHQYPCPAGTYNILTGKSDQNTECLLCPKGHYCPAATGHVDYWGVPGIPCPLGTYMDVEGGGTTEGDCKPCVAGYICNLATGTIDPVNDPDAACPSGYYSAAGASECSICEAGRYCPNSATSETDMNNNLCQAGYYCDQGSILDTGIDNFVCIKGYYCPAGTEAMLPCPPGTFNDLEQQVELSNCQKCTAGYWCEEAMDQPPHNEDYYGQRFVCATGHYCPTDISVDSSSQYHTNMGFPSIIGSTGPNEVPCPAGTYRDQTKGAQLSDCFTCTAGFYCLEGSSEQTTCPAGHYCETGNAQNPRPCLAGSFSDQVGLEVATNCTICTLGMYCDTEGLTTPAGLCDPGFICNLGSDTSQPQLTDLNRDGSPMGQPCPAGGYCISGSYQQIACPPKTYNPLTQQMDASNCVFCDAGFYCPPSGTTGLTSNGLPCPAGYYCPQESYYPLPCGAGNYCPDQASVPTKCPVGTYQQSNIAGHCDPCPPGQICQNEGMSNTTPCPTGSYCPQYSTSSTGSEQTTFDSRKSTYIDVTDADGTFGTSDPSGILCVPGTYQPYEEMFDVSACLSCPAGQYCANVGGSQPTNFCLPGYICLGGSITPTPNDNVSGRPCNVGNYCTQDSILDLQCPDGTYREITLGNSLSSCRPCDSGFYCPTPGMSNFTNNVCDDGYYCLADSNSGFGSSTPHQNRCAVGEFCENGNQNTCDSKTYQDLPGQNTCNICPDGKLCPQSDSDCAIDGNCVLDCDAGFYCTAGDKNTCAPGFYNLATGQTSAVDCAACPGGTYCTGSSADDPSNQKTQAGYYSSGGSTSLTPLDLSYCNNICSDVSSCNTACSSQDCNDCGICPEGYYCLEGTNDYKETPCPPGKYGDNSNFQTLSQCKECPAQKACPEEATTSATGSNPYLDCESGYYCTGSCTTTMPDDSVGSCGGICPEMHKCPTGTAVPVLCDDGQEASKNSADCSPCENGYTCTQSGSNIIKAACLPGGYCIAGVRTECPAGTFTSQTGAYNSTFCQECPPGVYCPQGTSDPSSNACAAGYYCPAGSQVPNPNICQVGTCCENGFSRPCPDGKSCNVDGIDCALTNSTTDYDCPAGSFCKDGNAAEPCPAGTYCPTGSVYPSLCSAGTKNLQNEQSLPAACETCSNGTYCWTAINLQADQICDAGYYCDSGSSTSQENKCPAGSFCTNGAQTVCPSGKYQSEETQDSCLRALEGYIFFLLILQAAIFFSDTTHNKKYLHKFGYF